VIECGSLFQETVPWRCSTIWKLRARNENANCAAVTHGRPAPFSSHGGLGAELTFYAFAPWLLRRNWIAAAALAVSLAVRMFIHYRVSRGDISYATLTFFFFPATLMFFMLGHFANVIGDKIALGLSPSLLFLFGAAVLFFWVHPQISIDSAVEYLAVVCFALSLPGLFRATKNNGLLNYFGDLTYPLYLTHGLVIVVLVWLLGSGRGMLLLPYLSNRAAASVILITCTSAVAIAAAAFIHRFVEEPARQLIAGIIYRFTQRRSLLLRPSAD